MKSLLKVLGVIGGILAVSFVTFVAMGHSPRELAHLGEVRNVYQDGAHEVVIPFPDGPRERLLPEVPVTTSGGYAFITEDRGVPVRHDPCRPIRWVLNTDGMPAFAEQEIQAAIADIELRSGLKFEFAGYTDEPLDFERSLFQDRYGDDYAPVIIGFSDASQTPDLAGAVTGVGGSTAIQGAFGPQRYLRSGVVVLDADDLKSRFASTSGALQARAIIMHELAHVLGLAHVDDPSQLMHPTHDRQLTWGDGDLAGLAIAGAGPCES
ncbi:MAG: matrixin family metalloprotease [Actinomycetes bacterium]|nr:MAG: peptidase [Actinomycetota bacterium]